MRLSCISRPGIALVLLGASASASAVAFDAEELTRQLVANRDRVLPRARERFDQWCRSDRTNASLALFRQRLDAIRALRDEIAHQLRQSNQTAIDELVIDVLGESDRRPQNAPTTTSPKVGMPAEQMYRRYLSRFVHRIDTKGLTAAEQAFLKVYYDAEVRAMIDEILRLHRPSAAAGFHEWEYYLILIPLLHSTSRFDAALLDELPGSLLTRERIHRLSDFCLLRVHRLDAAAAIAARLNASPASPDSAYEFYTSAASKCLTINRADLAVRCLNLAIVQLAPDDPRRIDLRFRICDTWSGVKNFALAIGEAGQIARDFPETPHAGKAMYLRVKNFADQEDSRSVLREVDDALAEPQCRPFLGELLFLKWQTLRKQGKGGPASRVLKKFLARFAKHPRAAEMHYAVAVDCLSGQRYGEARGILDSLVQRFPGTDSSRRAGHLLYKLDTLTHQGRLPTAAQPPGTP